MGGTRPTGNVDQVIAKLEAERELEIKLYDAAKQSLMETTKVCPKSGCGSIIERNQGCHHFKCIRCGADFCWMCKVMWTNRQPLHLDDCRFAGTRRVHKDDLDMQDYALGWDQDDGYLHAIDVGVVTLHDADEPSRACPLNHA